MTYSLDTLQSRNSSAKAVPGGVQRFAQEVGLIVGLLCLIFWLSALLSYSSQDAAWSTSGTVAGQALNWGGKLGAWLADASYFLLGFSAWWMLAAGARVWLSSLALWLRAESALPDQLFHWQRIKFWLSLLLLLAVSSGLEWSRLYRFEAHLPDHAGGALGYLVGTVGVKWLGFAGSGLVFIVLGVAAASNVFGFSWAHTAQRLGEWIYNLVDSTRNFATGRYNNNQWKQK